MNQSKWHKFLTAALLTALLVTALAPVVLAAEQAAPAAQVRASEVSGTIPGGQFAKIWLGLVPNQPGTVTVTARWDRPNPEQSGVGFYVLTEANLSAVINGAPLGTNNVAAGDTNFFQRGENNVQGAAFRATGGSYTLVVYNDSATDANFTLSVDNGVIVDESNQVRPVGVAAEETTPAATETPVAVTVEPTVEAPAAEATPEATAAPETPAAETTTVVAAGPFRSNSVRGELVEQFEQHYLGLEPEQRNAEITLRLSFDPRDNQELARRMSFWVLDEQGLRRYQAGENVNNVAVAHGNRATTPGDENVREASFTASGFGPYTVIVYNNSRIPATYELVATGAVLVDDALQTISAREAATTTVTTTAAAPSAAATGTTETTTTASAREGQPGGTYVVKAGDTLALIARDIYGDFRLYQQICTFNNIADCNRIEVGQVLNLPTREQIGAGATAPATTTTAVAAATPTTAATPATTAATPTVTTTAVTTPTAAVTTTATTTPTAGTTTTAAGTIAAIAASNPNFTILARALQATGLDATLSAGEYTVFAPTDAAFNELLATTGLNVNQLLQAPELAQILQYHVLSGKVNAADITNGMRATTVQGKPVTFEVRDGSVYINGAKVTIADIPASNGVIHAISAVILPPAQ
ncbi:fasciclin domain-containing protein [Caldilinea sp.]|uniref:fasciclin domain-containing protein n=1 Tax=Caldilinea sp. TaxID=2293560 RepID=UPI001B046BE0|nr:fasciclin domain-containing protein [Caldilinea sp.]MBO9394284.1 fasciclin domain-containing protein [Caldilinea sp.]